MEGEFSVCRGKRGRGSLGIWDCGYFGAEELAQLLGKGRPPKELLLCPYFNSCAKLELGQFKKYDLYVI